jgi:hypothetical protein
VPGLGAVGRLGSGEHVGVVAEAAAGDESPSYGSLAMCSEDVDSLGVEGQAVVNVGLRALLGRAALHPGQGGGECDRGRVEVDVAPPEGDHLAAAGAGNCGEAEVADHVVARGCEDRLASGCPGERSSQPGRRCATQRSMSWPTVTPDDGSTRWASTSTTSFDNSMSAALAPALVLGSRTVR